MITLRRIQENFVNLNKPDEIEEERRSLASQDFLLFDTTISKLIDIRKPEGDEQGYENIQYSVNPYG